MMALLSSLRVRLVLLILLAATPALAIILYDGATHRRDAIADARMNSLQIARETSIRHQAIIEEARQDLQTFVRLPQLLQGDPATCGALLAELAKGDPRYANIGVATPSGDVVCSAIPFSQPVNIADRSYFQEALQGRAFSVGKYQVGRITGRQSINAGYPMLDAAGNVQGVAFVAIDLSWLGELAPQLELGTGQTLDIVDRNGTILARYPSQEQSVGQKAPETPALSQLLAGGQGSVTDAQGPDGKTYLYAAERLGGTTSQSPLFVTVSTPMDAVLVEANRAFRDHLAILGLAVVAIVLVGLTVVELLVTRTIKSLVGATRAMTAGDLSTRTHLGHRRDELGILAASFDRMAEALQERDQAQRRAEDQLRTRTRELDENVKELRNLTGVLKAIRNVNQLIVREKDPQKLLQNACDLLVEGRGYSIAWTMLVDAAGKPVQGTAAGQEPTRSTIEARLLDGVCPTCVLRVMGSEGPLLVHMSSSGHADCPFTDIYKNGDAVLVARLGTADQPLGALGVALSQERAHDTQERGLVLELAADIGLALLNFESARRLRDSEQLHRDIAAVAEIGVARFNLKGQRTYVNDVLVRRTGMSREQLLNGSIGDRNLPEDRARARQLFDKCVATHKPIWGIIDRFEAGGRLNFLRTSMAPLFDPRGEMVGVQVTSLDITDLIETQEALRRSQELYRSLNQMTGASIARFDLEGRRTFVNEVFLSLYGGTEQDWIGGTLGDGAREEDRAWLWDRFRQCIQSGQPVRGGVKEIPVRGQVLYFRSDFTPVRGPDGSIAEVQITSMDVTDLTKALDRLRESEARYQSLVESTGGVVTRVDAEGRRTFVSANASALLGMSLEELRNKPFGDTMPPEERDRAMALLRETFRTGIPVHGFVSRQIVRGKPRWISANWVPIKDAHGRVVEVQTTSSDLTEQIEAQERLRESEALYRSLMDAATVGIVRVDRNGKRLFANAHAAAQCGLSHAEYMRGSFGDSLAPEERERARGALKQVFETGEPVVDFITYREANDARRVLSSALFPIKDATGKVIEVQITSVDITRQRELEEQFYQAQKMESVGRLAGGVAHDFNNLLTAIMGFTDLALEQVKDNATVAGYLREVMSAGERSTNLVRQLLAFSRRQTMEPKVVDANVLVRDMEKILRRVIGEDIQLTLALSPSPLMVRVDPGQMGQVLMNLAVNARDAMPWGGNLTIQVREALLTGPDSSLELSEGKYVVVSVSDTGTGMTEEVKRHLFEPFFTTKGQGRGTGLGLATCYGIVKQSGGGIHVSSELGRGTTMEVYLPRVGGTAHTSIQTVSNAPTLPVGTETLLLVEDETSVREFTAQALRLHGYTVLLASDGPRALRLVESRPELKVDLLLTDVVMPQMSGKELAERLTALRPSLKVLYMSGYPEDAIAHRGELEAGVMFIQKPVSIAQLVRTVRRALDQPQSEVKEG